MTTRQRQTAEPKAPPAEGPTPLVRHSDDPAERIKKGLSDLAVPFPNETIGKLPRVTCKACRDSQRKRCDDHAWIAHCGDCGGSHTSAAIHLDYVGHAAVTARLLAVDPMWSWEPMGLDEFGLPVLDRSGNLWIRLTVHGVTRIGVGDAEGSASSAKVLIGDAIRNAAMRFGVALDLWSRQDIAPVNPHTDPVFLRLVMDNISEASTRDELREIAANLRSNLGLLSEEDRVLVNEAWLARREKMGEPK